MTKRTFKRVFIGGFMVITLLLLMYALMWVMIGLYGTVWSVVVMGIIFFLGYVLMNLLSVLFDE